MSMEEIYTDTVVGVNFNNGVVKLILASQDLKDAMIEGDDKSSDEEVTMKSNKVITMPLAGFLYATSVIENLLKDPKMVATIEQYKKAGLLQSEDEKAKKE